MVAPPWYEVPPEGYGGTEQVIADLADGLTARGHRVVLVAAGGDHTDAEMRRTFRQPPDGLGTAKGANVDLLHAIRTARVLDGLELDLVHDHSFAAPLLARGRRVPTFITTHGALDEEVAATYASARNVSLVAIADHQRRQRPSLPWVGTVHNGIQVSTYPFSSNKDGPFVFLGRISPDKGPDTAAKIARALDAPLVIAAKCESPEEEQYLEETIEPLLGDGVRFIGTADADEKRELLSSARALLFPIRWEEPFGLVMVEAMACGTPVIATPHGSVPEIVVDGETGYVRDDFDGLVEAARRADRIDPAACRRRAAEHFDSQVMVAGYERVFLDVIASSPTTSSGR
jgi:glycosyltransferase involved in cell wall biosynthesis